MREKWVEISGYEIYQVSSLGRVRREGFIKKLTSGSGGYLTVSLSSEGSSKTHSVHRLVANHFILNKGDFRTVHHIDEDPRNNRVDNLMWCSDQYNIEASQAKSYVLEDPEGNLVEVFNMRKFCRESGLNQGNMSSVASGKREQHKGWKLYDR